MSETPGWVQRMRADGFQVTEARRRRPAADNGVWHEVRLWLAELLAGFAARIAPRSADGHALASDLRIAIVRSVARSEATHPTDSTVSDSPSDAGA